MAVDAREFADQAYERTTRTILETEHYEVKEEILNGILFLHLYVFDERLSVYKEMKQEWEKIKDECANIGWEHIFTYSQNHKFCIKWGGKLVNTVVQDGEEYGVYVWELKS